MRTPNILFYLIFASLIVQVACSGASDKNSLSSKQEPLEVYLVRHGEKVDQSRDPELSSAGYVRAAALAQTLRSVDIEHVHSTDFIRTRKTAEPAAAIAGLEIELYDPSDLTNFAEQLRSTGGRHLVVGHSNTTPRLVELLGGESGSEIDESNEYDRLYILTIGKYGEVNCILLRYGIHYIPDL